MKKIRYTLYFIWAVLLLPLTTILTAQNPYASLGIETKVLTLSEGKYQEFFPNETQVQIGEVLFDTEAGEIVAILEADTAYAEFQLKPEVMSRFLSLDPLARSFRFIRLISLLGISRSIP